MVRDIRLPNFPSFIRAEANMTVDTEEAIEVVTTQESRQVYRNQWMAVHEEIVSFANGGHGIFGVVDKPDFSLIVAMFEDRRIQLVRQHRYPVKGTYRRDLSKAPAVPILQRLLLPNSQRKPGLWLKDWRPWVRFTKVMDTQHSAFTFSRQ